MSGMKPVKFDDEVSSEKRKRFRERLLNSRLLSWLVNLPPVAWLTRTIVQKWLKRRAVPPPPTLAATIERAAASSLEATLYGIVQDVVDALGYAGAMVATYEQGDSLPVRAFYVDPAIATELDIRLWERRISEFAGYQVSITDPEVARVYVYKEDCADNLSVQAVKAGGPVTSDELYDLFVPIAPLVSKSIVQGIQQAMGVQQVIAVPFFLEMNETGEADSDDVSYELVGNLFAAKRDEISPSDIMVLSAFGRQAAAAMGSERRRLQNEIAHELIFRVQTSLNDEAKILEWIARGVVSDLGYVGAMVAPYEPDGSLPAYALYIDPNIADEDDIHRWEEEISQVARKLIRITDPTIARVYVDSDEYKDNLSVRAAKAGRPVTSNELFDLFRPIVPPAAHTVVQEIQKALGVCQVIAVPFFLETFAEGGGDDGPKIELVGNLFAATRSRVFKRSEIELLSAFGEHAAAGIRNARLYRKAEERQQAAQMFGRMAFSAATAVHALRNHIGVVRLHLELLERLSPDARDEQLQKGGQVKDRLSQAAAILDTLREPWHQISDEPTDVNACLRQAVNRVIVDQEREGILVKMALSKENLYIETSPDMLIEAFKVLIKNATEAIREKYPPVAAKALSGGKLSVRSRLDGYDVIEVLISDNGAGIKPENILRIFDIGWTTKRAGMGFGLFWARDYVEGLGGSISVESALNEGTTFHVRFPRP